MNKRGSGESDVLEKVNAIIFAALIIGILGAYVISNSDSTAFFQEYQAKDLGYLLEVISASPGDLIASYSNIKQGVELQYHFSPGEVSTYMFNSEQIQGVMDTRPENLPPIERYYGIYEGFGSNTLTIIKPATIVFTKTPSRLLVKEDVTFKSECVYEGNAAPNPLIDIQGNGKPEVEAAFHKIIAQNANANFLAQEGQGIMVLSTNDEEIIISEGSNVNKYFTCVLQEQFEAFTDKKVVLKDYPGENIVIETNTTLHDFDMIGTVLARGVLIYAKQ